jgi:hypothetical protein
LPAATVTYVYCVVQAASRPSGARLPAGVPGAARPRIVPLAAKLCFVAAEAPLSVYGEATLNDKLTDLQWVSDAAVGHEAIVEHFTRVRGATDVPMKLLTLVATEDKARTELLRGKRRIESALRRIRGCEEWGVRVVAAPAGSVAAAAGAASGSAPITGAAFLAARKAARDAAQIDRARAREAASAAYDVLVAHARAATQRALDAGPGTTPPLLDAAFLVPRTSRTAFKAAARAQAARCASAGAHMTLTGPWPAYNFVGIDGQAT